MFRNYVGMPLIKRQLTIFAGVMVLFLSCVSAAFGQMGNSAIYSDEWVDTSNPQAISIVGSGTTQDYQNYYGHTYWVVTKVTSPTGRTATATSYQSSSYAHIETHLSWDWNEPGIWFVETRHWMCCPYMGGNPFTGQNCISGGSSTDRFFGVSHAQYVKDMNNGDGTGRFVPISGCNVTCMPSSFNATLICPNGPEFKLTLQLWSNQGFVRICVPGAVKIFTAANCVQELAVCFKSEP
jgi:hypothetical protein